MLYGFVYDVDYSHIREMNALLGNIGCNLNQIAKRVNSTNTIYNKDMEEYLQVHPLDQELYPQVGIALAKGILVSPKNRHNFTADIIIRS